MKILLFLSISISTLIFFSFIEKEKGLLLISETSKIVKTCSKTNSTNIREELSEFSIGDDDFEGTFELETEQVSCLFLSELLSSIVFLQDLILSINSRLNISNKITYHSGQSPPSHS